MIILENVPCVVEKSVYSVVVDGQNFLQMSARSFWFSVWCMSSVFFLVFSLALSITVSRVLKFPALIVELPVCPFCSVFVSRISGLYC